MNGQIYQNLEEYESNEGYHLLFVKPSIAIKKKSTIDVPSHYQVMLKREVGVLEILISEGILDRP